MAQMRPPGSGVGYVAQRGATKQSAAGTLTFRDVETYGLLEPGSLTGT